MMNKKRIWIAGIIMFIFLIAIMIFTNPTQVEMDKWISNEHGIDCEYANGSEQCIKDNQLIRNNSSHYRNVGIFSSYEKNVEFEDGNQTTIRILGIFDNIFKIEDGAIWEILN